MNHSPVIIEEDLDEQIKKIQKCLKILEKRKQKEAEDQDLPHVWRYFRKDPNKKISAKRLQFFFEGSYHALGKLTKTQFKKKLLNHFDVTASTGGTIMGLELLDTFIYKEREDGKYFHWSYNGGTFTHERDNKRACEDGHISVTSANCKV